MPTVADQLAAIKRGAAELISEGELKAKLAKGTPLTIKAGFDPTAPDLHLGHTVLLRKLRQFQDLGHKVIFLIGDATALVGDPSGQSKMRKLMTEREIAANAQTYEEQVKKILLVKPSGVFERVFNSAWFGKREPFGLKELVELTAKYTVARLIERDDFQKRMKAGQEVSVLELLYPLMQGYDSVAIARRFGSCDVELGGTDQKFNLLVGRDLQRAYGQEPQAVLTTPLLEGTDGVQKMSKSLGNQIGINDPPNEMFGKVMSIPDTLIIKYVTLLTDVETAKIEETTQRLKAKAVNPRDVKADLAATLVQMYHSAVAAKQAREEFAKVFSRRELPSQMPVRVAQVDAAGNINLVDLLVAEGLAPSKREARRLLEQKAVKFGGQAVTGPTLRMSEPEGVLQVGSGRFLKVKRP